MFEYLKQAREEGRRDGAAARMMADDGVPPEVGGVYTVSPDFICGDRSYCRAIYRVGALNEGHALVSAVHGDCFKKEPFLLTIADRAWYPAEEMLNAATLVVAVAKAEG